MTDAAGLREIAARLLAGGEAAQARALAEALIARDGGDAVAHLLLARAAAAEGDWEGALPPARRAYRLSDGAARFAAARIAARAHFELGRDTRAQVWLRLAREAAPDAAAADAAARDYGIVRARNPLSVSLSFGIAPSSNVNGGSASDTITLPGLPFEFALDGEARALSGLRVSGAVSLGWRLRQGERSATFLQAQVDGRTYVLSGDAREQAPDARGADFSDVALVGSVAHRWRGEGHSGPSSLTASLGQSFYDGEPYLRFAQLTRERTFALTERDRIAVGGFAERTWRLEEDEAYWSLGARGRWTRGLASGDLSASLSLREGLTDLPDVGFDGVVAGLGWDRAEPVLGARLGLGAEIDWRDYDASAYARDGRGDLRATLRASLGLPAFETFGFEPTVRVEASRTESDVPLYDWDALSVDFGFRSSF